VESLVKVDDGVAMQVAISREIIALKYLNLLMLAERWIWLKICGWREQRRSGAFGEAAGPKQKPQAYEGCGASAICPSDLAGHEAAWQYVDSLQDPDDSHGQEQKSENSQAVSHRFPFGMAGFQGESYPITGALTGTFF
jgi:hypothetical protein